MKQEKIARINELARKAKAEGLNVTCETGPHYLLLDDSCLQEDGRFKMNPPLRDKSDREALLEGLADGTIDMIATDHAPHSAEDKAKGAAGMVGLVSAFAVCYTKLCRMEGLPLEMLSFLMSSGPAQVLGLDEHKGRLVPGFDADIVLVDTDHMFTVHADELHSKSKNCPYDGESFYGQVMMTIKGGKVTYQKDKQ